MKKIKLNKNLNLNKEAIVKMQETQLATVKGGAGKPASCGEASCAKSCESGSC